MKRTNNSRIDWQLDRLERAMNRRVFTQTVCATLFTSHGFAKKHLSLHIGHTGLTWIPLGPSAGGMRPPSILCKIHNT